MYIFFLQADESINEELETARMIKRRVDHLKGEANFDKIYEFVKNIEQCSIVDKAFH